MAGPGVLVATMRAERQRPLPRAAPPPFSRQHLIEASLTIEGRTFRTFVREGTPVNALIEKVAKENGGSVEKVFYPSMNASEIVSVRIGGICLAKSGTEGLHFYVGSSGIPFASLPSGIVFPNGDELRVRAATYDIHLGKTGDNFDPKSASDFGQKYAAGTRTTAAAMRRLQVKGAHGDSRSEKILLPENLLVIDKETGEIRTASEHAARIAVEGFAAPQFVTPTYTSVGLTMVSDRGVLAVPMDGSATRVPYFFVKAFDGRIADHVSVQFNALKAGEAAPPSLRDSRPRADAQSLYFVSAPLPSGPPAAAPPIQVPQPAPSVAAPPVSRKEEPRIPACAIPPARARKPPPPLTPATIGYYWRNPRPHMKLPPARPHLAVQSGSRQVPPVSAPVPPATASSFRCTPERQAKPRRKRKERAKSPPAPAAAPQLKRARPVSSAAPKARKIPKQPRQPAGLQKTAAKAKNMEPKPVTRAPGTALSIPKRAPALPKAKARATPGARPMPAAPARTPRPSNAKNRKKRKLPAYFIMGLLGLLPKGKGRVRRGRASAGN